MVMRFTGVVICFSGRAMERKTAVLLVMLSVLFTTSFWVASAPAQTGFQEFKRDLDASGKQNQGFGKFKKDLEEEYRIWLKDEMEWTKITLEDESRKQPEPETPEAGEKKGKEPSANRRPPHTRPDRVPLPENTFRVTSGFGYRIHPIHKRRVFHAGIDYGARRGTRILASAEGKILRAGSAGGYGNYILIKHANQYKTAYAHLEKIVVKKDQFVSRGELIGFVGSSGRSTGPHLHYEVVLRNKKINPAGLL